MEKSSQSKSEIFQWFTGTIGFLVLLFTLIYGKAGKGIIFICMITVFVLEYFFAFMRRKYFNPYIAMLLSPLLLIYYTSISDFEIRALGYFLLIYIINIAYTQGVKRINFSWLSSKAITIWFTAFIIFALSAVVLWRQGIQLSGDEPHYLMITQSLVLDGDFDLKNNYEEKDYLEYIPIEVRFHGGEYDGKYLSFHLPGVSFLLLPFYLLFKILGGIIPPALFYRLSAAVINAFFALCLSLILKKKFPDQSISGYWLLILIIFPLVIHATHLYPELPAATLMMFAYYLTFFEKKRYFLAGLFLSAIPWFHVKYIPPLILIATVILYNLIKPLKPLRLGKEKIKNIVLFLSVPAVSLILLLIYSKSLYGSFSPTSVFPQESYWSVPWLLRLKVFFAYFLDQRDGLLFYSPLFILFFFSFKKKLEHKILLLGIAFIYVFFHAFTTVRGAYAPAGRPLIFVSWIFILFIAHYYFNRIKPSSNPLSPFIFRFLAGMGFFIVVWIFYYPLFVYQPVFAGTVQRASGFNLFWGSNFIELWKFFPSFLTKPPDLHIANLGWIIFFTIALSIFYLKKTNLPFKQINIIVPFFSLIILTYAYCFYPHIHLISQNKYTDKSISFYNNSKNFLYIPERKGFRIKGGNSYDIYIDRHLVHKEKIIFHFSHTDITSLTLRNGRHLLYSINAGESNRTTYAIPVANLDSLKVNNKLVSHIGIETHTSEPDSFLWLEIE